MMFWCDARLESCWLLSVFAGDDTGGGLGLDHQQEVGEAVLGEGGELVEEVDGSEEEHNHRRCHGHGHREAGNAMMATQCTVSTAVDLADFCVCLLLIDARAEPVAEVAIIS